ncbi:hypothetical protein [Streptomyces sp. NBC_00038]|uniref:hypothetical protein n=1 Tax=Streptomyces sp. NBC_00038 TaxID=2903615 RepID=UPI002259AA7B|nr:hypothetical protein [Streptomyces sp. NBC_00038]MCX5556554.1 hypothetical protein [Streptomyces sp. NBC_00038]
MKRPGPVLTLLAGLVLGLFLLSLNATTGTKSASSSQVEAPAASTSPSPKSSATPSPSPTKTTASPTPSKSAPPNADYAGRTDDDSSAVAVSVRDGKAIAYFCDGHDKESWLKGDIEDDGTMKLTGKNGAELNGTLQSKRIRGTVDLEGQRYGFTADKAVKPSGLYRATATVRGALVDGGWVVLQGDGRDQVGIVNRDGEPSAAPDIDPETGAVTIDGEQLTAEPVTP